MKKTLVILVTLLTVTIVTGEFLYAKESILRSNHYFMDDVGGKLILKQDGHYDLFVSNSKSVADKHGKYGISETKVILYNLDGSVYMSCPFQWETKGVKIKWVEIDRIKLYRK